MNELPILAPRRGPLAQCWANRKLRRLAVIAAMLAPALYLFGFGLVMRLVQGDVVVHAGDIILLPYLPLLWLAKIPVFQKFLVWYLVDVWGCSMG